MDFRAYVRQAVDDQQGEPYIEHGPADGVFEPSVCSYCGNSDFETPVDNGRAQRATCSTCGATMVSAGGQWMPDLIGQPDNHPSMKPDPRSGGVGGAGAVPVQLRETDLSSRTAGARGELPEDFRIENKVYGKDDDEHADLESHLPGWEHHLIQAHGDGRDEEIGRLEYSAQPTDKQIKIHETRVNSRYTRRGVASAMNSAMVDAHPHHDIDRGAGTEDGEGFRRGLDKEAGVDWCRHRRTEHCWLPRNDSQTGGFALYQPQDRGVCPWTTANQQMINCPMSEPSAMAGMSAKGSITDTDELRFHFCATWADVRAKAKRIRSEGGVSIVSVLADGVTGHVQGDTGIYESQINYVPGSRKVGFWQCGCAWSSFTWGRSPAFRRFEGRMCSHVLALQFEAQSWEMSGLPATEDTQRPGWMRDEVRVRHDRSTRDHDVRAANLQGNRGFVCRSTLNPQANLDPEGVYPSDHGLDLEGAPIHAFATVAYAQRGDPADAMRVYLAAGMAHEEARELLGAVLAERIVVAKDEAPTEPTHAGVVLKAADTGRILMIQRSNNDEKDPAAGTWEFPGGKREDDDHNSLMSGIREFQEEVGQEFPAGGHVSHVWQSPNGVYQGHVVVVPNESAVDFSNGRATVNPDNPDGDDHEQSAWWDPDHARKNPALRPECKNSPWDKIKTASLDVDAGFLDRVRHIMNDTEPMADPGGPDWRGNRPAGDVPDDQHTCADCGKPAEAYSHLHGVGYCAEHADQHLSQRPRPVQVHADYSAHDDLGDLQPDWRPKAPPKAPGDGQGENPGSTGWATSGDPPEWENASESPLAMTSWSTLHNEPESALPSTDGAEETEGERFRSQMRPEIDPGEMLTPSDGRTASVDDIVTRFQTTAGAQALQGAGPRGDTDMDIASAARAHLAQGGIRRTALKDFSATERQELISEGLGGRARNHDDLDIVGTHYSDLVDAMSREQSLDEAAADLFA